MNKFGRLMQLLGFTSRRDERPNPDPIRGDLTRALQANERAGNNAQRALEDLLADRGRMGETFQGIVGKMK